MAPADGEGSDEYRSGEDDDADNEATIEEEEALAAVEGRDVKVRSGEGGEGGVREVLGCNQSTKSSQPCVANGMSGLAVQQLHCMHVLRLNAARNMLVRWLTPIVHTHRTTFAIHTGHRRRRLMSWLGWTRRLTCP